MNSGTAKDTCLAKKRLEWGLGSPSVTDLDTARRLDWAVFTPFVYVNETLRKALL